MQLVSWQKASESPVSYMTDTLSNLIINIHATFLNSGNEVETEMFFDTIKVSPRLDISEIKIRAAELKMNFRYFADETVGVSLDETTERTDVRDILWVFGTPKSLNQVAEDVTPNSLEGTFF